MKAKKGTKKTVKKAVKKSKAGNILAQVDLTESFNLLSNSFEDFSSYLKITRYLELLLITVVGSALLYNMYFIR